jgi:hypothetical protein
MPTRLETNGLGECFRANITGVRFALMRTESGMPADHGGLPGKGLGHVA